MLSRNNVLVAHDGCLRPEAPGANLADDCGLPAPLSQMISDLPSLDCRVSKPASLISLVLRQRLLQVAKEFEICCRIAIFRRNETAPS